MNLTKTINTALTLLLFSSCGGLRSENDVYNVIPLGTELSIDILRLTSQVVVNGAGELVLVCEPFYGRDDEYNPHLLFFKDNKLTGACYFPSERILSIKEGTINARSNTSRIGDTSLFRNDIPSYYKLELVEWANDGFPNSYDQNFDRLLNKVVINKFDDTATFYFNISVDTVIHIYRTEGLKNKENEKYFSIKDSIKVPLEDMYFAFMDYPGIPFGWVLEKNKKTYTRIAIRQEEDRTKFLQDLFEYLKKR